MSGSVATLGSECRGSLLHVHVASTRIVLIGRGALCHTHDTPLLTHVACTLNPDRDTHKINKLCPGFCVFITHIFSVTALHTESETRHKRQTTQRVADSELPRVCINTRATACSRPWGHVSQIAPPCAAQIWSHTAHLLTSTNERETRHSNQQARVVAGVCRQSGACCRWRVSGAQQTYV